MPLKLCVLSLCLCSFLLEVNAQSGRFLISNTSGVSRSEEPVVISRIALEGLVSVPTSGKVAVLNVRGNDIPSQLDDLNQDGQWDELAFQVDLDRNSSVDIKIKWVDLDEAPRFPHRARVILGLAQEDSKFFKPANRELRPDDWTPGKQPPRYQLEGPAWENDRVAFRRFFDSRNSTDIFGKTTPKMVLDSVDMSFGNYHQMRSWGMHILKIGSSLGAGGIAIVEKGLPMPLRNTETAEYYQIANGPVRAMFDLVFEGWRPADGPKYNVKERISIWAGKLWYKSEVTISGFIGDKELAVGIANLKNPSQAIYKTNNLAYTSLCTHARQSENNDMLGMGLLFSSKIFSGYGEAPKVDLWPNIDTVSHTYYAKLKIRSGQPAEYFFFAGWEKTEARFANAKYFTDAVQEEADRREYPLVVGKK